MTDLDLDAMERRATAIVELKNRTTGIKNALAQDVLADDNLALIARVRELEAKVAEQRAIISTGMSAFSYGRSQGREEGIAAERKRCAEVARGEMVDADATDDEGDRAYNRACEDIAAAIERGDA